ncbi:hypothetical protein [Streptomyces sp. NPDC005004]
MRSTVPGHESQAFQGAYRLPLFHAIEQARGEHAYRQLPVPAPTSGLAADDAPLDLYCAAHLIQNSYTAGLAHADALRRLTAADEIDPTNPWTLLRGALENFATGLWLLDGTGRSGRRRRAVLRSRCPLRAGERCPFPPRPVPAHAPAQRAVSWMSPSWW